MNREILFRGKRVDNGEWVYGVPTKDEHGELSFLPCQFYAIRDAICLYVDENTVGQYTGLKDKNEKKIFEGDILLKGFEKVLVKWNGNQCRWCIYSNNYEICGFNENTQGYFEVIGNIYDNSELLEVEE